MFQGHQPWGKLPEYLTEFHCLMRNLEDLNGNFPGTEKMEALRQEAMVLMSRGASTCSAARTIRRKYNLPVIFVSKHHDIMTVIDADTMRATARRLNGRRGAAWNAEIESEGRAALVREAELLALAAGSQAKLYTEYDVERIIREGTPPTPSSTTPQPIDAQNLTAANDEMVQGLLALRSGQPAGSTRPRTIRLNFRAPQAPAPNADEAETDAAPVETRRTRKAPGTRRTTVLRRRRSTVEAAPAADAPETVAAPAAPRRRRIPQGTRRTALPALTAPVPAAPSPDAAPSDSSAPPQPQPTTTGTAPPPPEDMSDLGAVENWVHHFRTNWGNEHVPSLVSRGTGEARSTGEPVRKKARKTMGPAETISPLDSGVIPTSIESLAQVTVAVVPVVVEQTLTREDQFRLAAEEAGRNADLPRQPRQTRGRR